MRRLQLVKESFDRVRSTSFSKRFYELLLASDPRIRDAFSKTDFQRQHELFLHGLRALIIFAEGGATGKLAIDRLAQLHDRQHIDIAPHLYDTWIDCLVTVVRETDPQPAPDLEAAWREVIRQGIDAMAARY